MNIFDNYLLIITKIILKNKESLNLNNLKYKSLIWETSVISKRIISWILNADIILKNSNFDFKRNFIESIVIQTNHLKKNFKYEIDHQK